MVAADEVHAAGVAELEADEKGDCLDAEEAAVDVVACWLQVVSCWRRDNDIAEGRVAKEALSRDGREGGESGGMYQERGSSCPDRSRQS